MRDAVQITCCDPVELHQDTVCVLTDNTIKTSTTINCQAFPTQYYQINTRSPSIKKIA